MAAPAVNLAETLRPWHTAGITHFLADSPFGHEYEPLEDCLDAESMALRGSPADRACHCKEAGLTAETGALTDPSLKGPAAKEDPACFNTRKTGAFAQQKSASRAGSSSSVPPVAPSAASPAVPSNASPAASPSASSAVPSNASPAASSVWPEAWAAFLPERRNSFLLWSYAELAVDLGGQPSKERSACLRDIIGHLDMPAGTSVFWPVALPVADASGPEGLEPDAGSKPDAALEPDAKAFQAGVDHLNPRVIVFLGKKAAVMGGILPASEARPYSQHIVKGRMVICLPSFARLMKSPRDLDNAKTFLRAAVSRLRAQAVSQ